MSKRVFQENKARQIFRKTNISYPLIRTRTKLFQWLSHSHSHSHKKKKFFLPFLKIISLIESSSKLFHIAQLLVKTAVGS